MALPCCPQAELRLSYPPRRSWYRLWRAGETWREWINLPSGEYSTSPISAQCAGRKDENWGWRAVKRSWQVLPAPHSRVEEPADRLHMERCAILCPHTRDENALRRPVFFAPRRPLCSLAEAPMYRQRLVQGFERCAMGMYCRSCVSEYTRAVLL